MEENSKFQEKFVKFIFICFVAGWGLTLLLSPLSSTGGGIDLLELLVVLIVFFTGVTTLVLGLIAVLTSLNTKSWQKPGIFNTVWFPLLLSSPPLIYFAMIISGLFRTI